MLRQQMPRTDTRPNRSLADYVAPRAVAVTTSAPSRSASTGAEELARRYEAQNDDYRAIIVKALADRLAEAFAEYAHLEARRAWYEPAPQPTIEDLHAERFRGIRPAFGYPACPDHSEKGKLVDLLDAEPDRRGADRVVRDDAGRERQRAAARPPAARYFAVGRIGRDQVEDYAARKRVTVEEAEYWLRPNLAYEPVRPAMKAAG